MLINSIAAIVIMASGFPAFDHDTGEIKEGVDCSKYYTEIDSLLEQMRGSQTKIDNAPKIRDQINQAKAEGCQPPAEYGVSAGMRSTVMSSDKSAVVTHVPASPSEVGVPKDTYFTGFNFDFITSIFPQARPVIDAVTSATGNSGASGGGSQQ